MSPAVTGEIAWFYFYARKYELALEQALRAQELDPEDLWSASCILHSAVQLGRYRDAVAPAQALMRQKGASAEDLASIAQESPEAGLKAYYEWNVKYFGARQERGDPAGMALALMHIRLGNRDEALTWLQKAFDARTGGLTFLAVEPRMDPLRTDPRFAELLQRIGLPRAPRG